MRTPPHSHPIAIPLTCWLTPKTGPAHAFCEELRRGTMDRFPVMLRLPEVVLRKVGLKRESPGSLSESESLDPAAPIPSDPRAPAKGRDATDWAISNPGDLEADPGKQRAGTSQ